ncbi:MAG TPA: CBS domain-containing protein [Acidimicrobiales bacterium]|nr:CBS domain-containing protein [Acidimicrobiales bacterium]
MRISTLLANKGSDVATIRGDATVADAVDELSRHHVGALVVSDDGQTIEGIVSERDVVRTMSELGEGVVRELVSSIMSSTVTTCSPEDDTESLMRTMTERRIRHVPVTDGGRLVGIVSIGDIVKDRIEELEKNRTELIEYITAR